MNIRHKQVKFVFEVKWKLVLWVLKYESALMQNKNN